MWLANNHSTVIFSNTGSPQVKILQKVLEGLLFWLTLYTTPCRKKTGPPACGTYFVESTNFHDSFTVGKLEYTM